MNLSLSVREENLHCSSIGVASETVKHLDRHPACDGSAAAGQVALSRNPGPLVNLNLRPDLNKVLGLNLLPHGRFSTGTMRWVLLLTLHENIHAPLKVHFIPPRRTQARP